MQERQLIENGLLDEETWWVQKKEKNTNTNSVLETRAKSGFTHYEITSGNNFPPKSHRLSKEFAEQGGFSILLVRKLLILF